MDFESFWSKYPKKLGKKAALRHFKGNIKTKEDCEKFDKSLNNYIKKIKDEKIAWQYVMHGSTFFYNWEDYIEYKTPVKISKEDQGTREFNDKWRQWQMEAGQVN